MFKRVFFRTHVIGTYIFFYLMPSYITVLELYRAIKLVPLLKREDLLLLTPFARFKIMEM